MCVGFVDWFFGVFGIGGKCVLFIVVVFGVVGGIG